MTDPATPAPRSPAALSARVRAALVRAVPSLAGRPLEDDAGLLGQGLGIDSVETLAVVAAVEEEFDLTLDDAMLRVEHFRTVGALVAFVGAQVAAQRPRSGTG